MHACFVELALVQRHAIVGVRHRVLEAGELQGLEFVAGDGFFTVKHWGGGFLG